MSADHLDSLLKHFSISTSLLYSGPVCGEFDETLIAGKGHLHVIQCGHVEVRHSRQPTLRIVEPTLLFYPQPLAHRFVIAESGADFVCATVAFHSEGRINPVVEGLPPLLVVPLARMPEMRATIDLLFAEIMAPRHGRQVTVDRLFEVMLVQLLRKIIAEGMLKSGVFAGLAHPQLCKAISALHEAPAQPWTLEKLAMVAGMSRSRFAGTFKTILGLTAANYLCRWRLALAQDLLRHDTPLKHVATTVGYGSPVALTRAFKANFGVSPRAWLQSEIVDSQSIRSAGCM